MTAYDDDDDDDDVLPRPITIGSKRVRRCRLSLIGLRSLRAFTNVLVRCSVDECNETSIVLVTSNTINANSRVVLTVVVTRVGTPSCAN